MHAVRRVPFHRGSIGRREKGTLSLCQTSSPSNEVLPHGILQAHGWPTISWRILFNEAPRSPAFAAASRPS